MYSTAMPGREYKTMGHLGDNISCIIALLQWGEHLHQHEGKPLQ